MAKAFVRFAVKRRATPIHQNVGNIAPSVHFGKSAADALSRSGGLSPSYPLSCPHVVENHAACPRSYPQNVHNSLIFGFVIHNTPCIACRGPIKHGDKGNESARHPHAIEHGEIRTQSIHTTVRDYAQVLWFSSVSNRYRGSTDDCGWCSWQKRLLGTAPLHRVGETADSRRAEATASAAAMPYAT